MEPNEELDQPFRGSAQSHHLFFQPTASAAGPIDHALAKGPQSEARRGRNRRWVDLFSPVVSASEDYELRYFARKHNIPLAEARRLLKLHGNDRETLEAAVGALAK
jgi:hypothetical protein